MTLRELLFNITNGFQEFFSIIWNGILDAKIEDIAILIGVGIIGLAVVYLFMLYKNWVENLENILLKWLLNPFFIAIYIIIIMIAYNYFVLFCYKGSFNTPNPINYCF
jgi:hypothetical protein